MRTSVNNYPISSPFVSLIILTWNSQRYIKKCIESYYKSFIDQGLRAEFIIVDNASTDNTVKTVEHDIKPFIHVDCAITLIRLNKNFGTTVSRNLGIRKSKGKFIIICDSDTEFLKGDWIKAFSSIESDQSIGILAPCLYYADGMTQPSVKKFPTLADKLRKIPKIFWGFSIEDRDFYRDFPWSDIKAVNSAISACWILSRRTVDVVGMLDEKIFYSPEDLDYCLRIWKSKKKVYFYPHIKITHHTQQISHNKPFSLQSVSHFKGLLYYFIKHRYCFSRNRLMKRINADM